VDVVLTPDQELLRDTTRRFLEAECPLTAVRGLEHEPSGFDRAIWRRGAQLGWTSLLVAEADGGGSVSGRPVADLAVVAEEMGRMVAAGPLVPVNLMATAVSNRGTEAQRTEVLPGLLSGDDVAAWAAAEPGWRGDLRRVACRARRSGDDLVIDGVKSPVEAGAEARWLLVVAELDDHLVQVLVPADLPGVEITSLDGIDLVRRHAEVRLSGAVVPASSLIAGDDCDEISRLLQIAAVLQCAESCGALQRVFDMTLEYLADRYSFGRPLASYQALKHRMADMAVALETSQAITTAAVRAIDDQRPDVAELVSAAKSYVGAVGTELTQECVQLHGGIGVTWEHDLHLFLRRITINRNTYGTVTDHRELVACGLGLGGAS
jgi:alkylation response protein AidB-like acyl-CoA dehydrogenase